MRAFYAYLIQKREYGEDTLIKVDAFANIEEDRLDYIRMNQNDLWYNLYHNISEVVLKGDVQGSSPGKIILPSSVTGSPRYMINNYQWQFIEHMEIPNLFITFTCNTKAKLLDMLKFIKYGVPFDKIIASNTIIKIYYLHSFNCKKIIIVFNYFVDVYAIEFQKRGLPHTRILIWLALEFKFKTSGDIDSIVSTKMPDKNIDPLCNEIVSKFMIHGPCGVARPGAQCMSGNVCAKSFPKKFRSSTTLGNNRFVYYRLHDFRDNFVLKNGIMLFNDYAVPYNKELLMHYNTHINVEICY
uniref:Helitron helicase-like domain-containing protein n=1 Tax=Salix viminalis TaxID=40686 RepID=A0A6N2NLV3_SALVM